MQRTFLLGVLCALCSWSHAQSDTVLVHPERYVLDQLSGLAVIAEDVAQINAEWPGAKQVFALGVPITLHQPIETVEVGVPYAAVDESGAALVLYFTDLPLVWIDTPHAIVDEPKVHARFRLQGLEATLATHHIGIEVRGASTQTLPKKSYRIEFWADESGAATTDVALLGMRNDDDWILFAQYNEPLRIGTQFGQELWMDVHRPYYGLSEPQARCGVRMRPVELVLNGRYTGVYSLSEVVDRKQLGLQQHQVVIRGKLYQAKHWSASVDMTELVPYNDASLEWDGFEYVFPEEMVEWNDLYSFVDLVVNAGTTEFMAEVPARFHLQNAVDYFLLLNLFRAVDNRSKNVFIARYDIGEPYFYVPWDLDGLFGIQWDGVVDHDVTSILSNALFQRLRMDCASGGFMHRVQQRWLELRATHFSAAALKARYRNAHDRLVDAGAYRREEQVWEGFTYNADEIMRVEAWIDARLNYLDGWFAAQCPTAMLEELPVQLVSVYPNPAVGQVMVEAPGMTLPATLVIYDAVGRSVMQQQLSTSRTTVPLDGLPAGVYQIHVRPIGQQQWQGRLIVN